jgi:hypothetical protein
MIDLCTAVATMYGQGGAGSSGGSGAGLGLGSGSDGEGGGSGSDGEGGGSGSQGEGGGSGSDGEGGGSGAGLGLGSGSHGEGDGRGAGLGLGLGLELGLGTGRQVGMSVDGGRNITTQLRQTQRIHTASQTRSPAQRCTSKCGNTLEFEFHRRTRGNRLVTFSCQLTPGAVRLACARVSRAIIIRQRTVCNTLLSRCPRCRTIATRLPATRLLPALIIWTKWQLV